MPFWSARACRGQRRRANSSATRSSFLPTVQIGITLVSMLTGVFGGARIAGDVAAWLAGLPPLASAAETISLAVVVIVTTYLTLVLGELVPKHLALRHRSRSRRAWLRRSPGWVGPRSGRLAARQVVRRGAPPVRSAPHAAAVRDRGGAEGTAHRGRADRRAGDRGTRHDRTPACALPTSRCARS